MTGHRMIIAAGPSAVRRLCCGDGRSADTETDAVAAALEYLDDPVALVDDEPIEVAALWARLLGSAACPGRGERESMVVIHPSWWWPARVERLVAAAGEVADRVVAQPRCGLLGADDEVVVEIADRLVSISTTTTVAEPRIGSPRQVADAVCRRVIERTGHQPAAVRIDAPSGVGGATELAAMIVGRLRRFGYRDVQTGSDAEIAAAAARRFGEPAADPPARRHRRLPVLAASLALLGVVAVGAGAAIRPAPAADVVASIAPAVYLVEGRVAMQVPADWPVRRVTTGPGSARVEVVSPADPQTILHLTQSPAPGDGLAAAGEAIGAALHRADTAGPPGVFAGFDASGSRAGRPAVTYRELRPSHRIDWTVLVDGAVRISIGCQRRPDDDSDVVGPACEQAVRSARALR